MVAVVVAGAVVMVAVEGGKVVPVAVGSVCRDSLVAADWCEHPHTSTTSATKTQRMLGRLDVAQATNASGAKLSALGMTAAGSVPIQFPSSSV